MELDVSQGSAFTPSQGPHITQGHSCSSQLKWFVRCSLHPTACYMCLFVLCACLFGATWRCYGVHLAQQHGVSTRSDPYLYERLNALICAVTTEHERISFRVVSVFPSPPHHHQPSTPHLPQVYNNSSLWKNACLWHSLA